MMTRDSPLRSILGRSTIGKHGGYGRVAVDTPQRGRITLNLVMGYLVVPWFFDDIDRFVYHKVHTIILISQDTAPE